MRIEDITTGSLKKASPKELYDLNLRIFHMANKYEMLEKSDGKQVDIKWSRMEEYADLLKQEFTRREIKNVKIWSWFPEAEKQIQSLIKLMWGLVKPSYRIFVMEDLRKIPDMSRGKLVIESKFDGARAKISKTKSDVIVFTDPEETRTPNKNARLPWQVEELKQLPGEFELDAEIVMMTKSGKEILHRTAVNALINGKFDPAEASKRAHIYVFDIVSQDEVSTRMFPLKERKEVLNKFKDSEHIHFVMPTTTLSKPSLSYVVAAGNMSNIKKAKENIMIIAHKGGPFPKGIAEGVMIKKLESTYSGKTWAKWKENFEIDALVTGKHLVKGQTDVWYYDLSVGPITTKHATAIGKDKKSAVVKYNDKLWNHIGRSSNSKENVAVGKIIRIASEDVNRFETRNGVYSYYGGYINRVLQAVPERDNPDNLHLLRRLSELTQPRKSITKGIEDEVKASISAGKIPKPIYDKYAKESQPLPKEFYTDYRQGRAWAQCLSSPETPIFTREGWKRYCDIKEGDYVLAHSGKFRKVTQKNKFLYEEDWWILTVEFEGYKKKLRVTREHPFLTPDGFHLVTELKPGHTILSFSERSCLYCWRPIPLLSGWARTGIKGKYCSQSCATKAQHTKQGPMFGDAYSKLKILRDDKLSAGKWGFQNAARARAAVIKANRILAQNRFTYPHKVFEKMLRELGIIFEHEYPVETYSMDVAIPDLKIDFEIDGKRHHDPKKDAVRDSKLSELGWTTVRIPASYLTKKSKEYDPDKVVEIIKNTISNEAHLYQFAAVHVVDCQPMVVSEKTKTKAPWTKYAYNLTVSKDHSYYTPMMINHNSHIRGIDPQKVSEYKKGVLPFEELLVGKSIHIDLRIDVGLEKLVQFVIVDNEIESYLKYLTGQTRETKVGPRVQHSLMVVKPSAEEPQKIVKAEFMSITEAGAKQLAEMQIKAGSYFIEPGGIGATRNTASWMGLIWAGRAMAGVQRRDFHEWFLIPRNLPSLNGTFFNGRFIFKALKGEKNARWETWKAAKNPLPAPSIDHKDSGYYYPVKANEVGRFGRENYTYGKK